MAAENVSSDLIWEIVNRNNSYLCKRRSAGGVYFSRDPLNLTNKHTRKNAGFVNDKAIGVNPAASGKGVALTTKKTGASQKPAASFQTTTFGAGSSSRKTSRGVVNATAKRGYRADLRRDAVARASAIKRAQGTPRKVGEPKLRGKKAKAQALKE